MESRVFREFEGFEEDKAIHVPLFEGERTRVVMLCLAPGTGVPMHKHPGFEVTLIPVRGKGKITSADGQEITLEPGSIHFDDGESGLDPHNPFEEPFVMLVHRVKM